MRIETIEVDGVTMPHYIADEGEHIVITGPIVGAVTDGDGQVFDVTPPVIAVESQDKAVEVAALIDAQMMPAPETTEN